MQVSYYCESCKETHSFTFQCPRDRVSEEQPPIIVDEPSDRGGYKKLSDLIHEWYDREYIEGGEDTEPELSDFLRRVIPEVMPSPPLDQIKAARADATIGAIEALLTNPQPPPSTGRLEAVLAVIQDYRSTSQP